MPFLIIHNDICNMNTDAIVNAANSRLLMGGGVCGAIFNKAGADKLQEECNAIGCCVVGHAVMTKGYDLPAKYIIHAVGPVYHGGDFKEKEYLSMAYTNSLKLAQEHGLNSIAFPLISTGIYGYPKEEALSVAILAIEEFLKEHDMMIYLVVYDRTAVSLSEKKLDKITHYIDTYYKTPRQRRTSVLEMDQIFVEAQYCQMKEAPCRAEKKQTKVKKRKLNDLLETMDETFSQMLLRLIDEKGMTDVEVYKRANLDRKLFSKIRNNLDYTPKKATVLALAVGLQLSLDETIDLLSKAGFALSRSHKFDVIIQYYIENQDYNMYEINEMLFHFEQPLLGNSEIK